MLNITDIFGFSGTVLVIGAYSPMRSAFDILSQLKVGRFPCIHSVWVV